MEQFSVCCNNEADSKADRESKRLAVLRHVPKPVREEIIASGICSATTIVL